jgi:hypothetical protein
MAEAAPVVPYHPAFNLSAAVALSSVAATIEPTILVMPYRVPLTILVIFAAFLTASACFKAASLF